MRYNFFRDFYEKVIKRIHPLIYVGLILAVITVIVVSLVIRLRPGYDPLTEKSMEPLLARELLRVGVRSDVEKFSQIENGVYSGFEDDIARRLGEEIFGEEALVEFVSVDNTTRNIRLGEKEIDCLIALCPQNYSASFIYSDPYYTDAVAIVVNKGSYQSIEDFVFINIGALQRPSPARTPVQNHGALTALQRFSAGREKGVIDITIYSSIENMFEALANGNIQAIAIENSLLNLYYDETSMDVLPEAIATLPYSIVTRVGNEDFINLCNNMIHEMKNNGEMDALLGKWNLVDYSNSKTGGTP